MTDTSTQPATTAAATAPAAPADDLRWAHEVAPEPEWAWDRTTPAETFAVHLLARAAAWQNTMTELMGHKPEPTSGAEGRPVWWDYTQLYVSTAYSALMLVRQLAGDTYEQAANYAHNALCAGDTAAEVIWSELDKRGIDPDKIRPYLPRWYVRDLDIEGLGPDADNETTLVMARGHHERATFHEAALSFLSVSALEIPPATAVRHVWARFSEASDDDPDAGYLRYVTPRDEHAFPATVLDVTDRGEG